MPSKRHFYVLSFPRGFYWDERWHDWNIQDIAKARRFRTKQAAVTYCDSYIKPEYFYVEEFDANSQFVDYDFFDNTL